MKRLANFVVSHHKAVLGVALVLTILCGLLALQMPVNRDRTQYLSDASRMKQGMHRMETAFPNEGQNAVIRVMLRNVAPEQKQAIADELRQMPKVDSVAYEENSPQYNRDPFTLFAVTAACSYGSEEEAAMEAAIAERFAQYGAVVQNNGLASTEVPLWLLACAVGLAVLVLLVMSHSWLDPLLFLLTIGLAVVINAGTNGFLPYIDEMTATVGPILQLVLSMDYSIMLLTRYRREKEKQPDSLQAMQNALTGSAAAIASSSLTTVVGLLALVFLSFKLGPELGLVLAKGVFVSMLCVFTVLPALVLLLDKQLEQTRKKTLRLNLQGLAGFSFRARKAIPLVFALLFAASLLLQPFTAVTFTEKAEDAIAKVFPKENTIVLLYPNQEEAKLGGIVQQLEADANVTRITAYANTLGQTYTPAEMAAVLHSMSSDAAMDELPLRMVYFLAAEQALPSLTAAQFAEFLSKDVLSNEAMQPYMNEDLQAEMQRLTALENPQLLNAPCTPQQLAAILGTDTELVDSLLLYRALQKGVAESDTMTLAAFADFLLLSVAQEQAYAALLDPQAIADLQQVNGLIAEGTLQPQHNAAELGTLLGMPQEWVEMLFRLAQAGDGSATAMPLRAFVNALCTQLGPNTPLAHVVDAESAQRLQQMNALVQMVQSGAGLTAEQAAQAIGMDTATVAQLYRHYGFAHPSAVQEENITVPLADFIGFVANQGGSSGGLAAGIAAEQAAALQQLQALVDVIRQDAPLDAAAMAALLGMETETVGTLLRLFTAENNTNQTMSLVQIADLLLSEPLLTAALDEQAMVSLHQMQAILQASANGTEWTAKEMAALLGMEEAQTESLYVLYRHRGGMGEMLSVSEFVRYAATEAAQNRELSASIDAESAEKLIGLHRLLTAVTEETAFTAQEMYALLGSLGAPIGETETEVLYLCYGGLYEIGERATMTLPQLFTLLCNRLMNDERFSLWFDSAAKEQLLQAKESLDAASAQLIGTGYSRAVLSTTYAEESADTERFIDTVKTLCDSELKEYYLIGNSVMASEMAADFQQEYLRITLITAIAIFLVVLLTFHRPLLPLVLTLLVQCGVLMTTALIGAISGGIYYLALLIVQSILMGATIDYGIVFSHRYRESRATMPVPQALAAAYEASAHTILTSGSILVLVLAALGLFAPVATVAEVSATLSIGALIAVLLILLVLPGVLACFDKRITKRKNG